MLARWADLTGNDTDLVRSVAELVERYADTGEPQLPEQLNLDLVFPPYTIPSFCYMLGHEERALETLEQGYEQRAFGVVGVMLGPPLERLREHPRYVALAQKGGFIR